MAKNKTTETGSSVTEFINMVENEVRRNDSFELIKLFKSITGHEPKMWGTSIIGFGSYHYKYESGREDDAPLAAFSPRKDSLVLYFATEFDKREELRAKLGKHKSATACIYVKKLDDVDLAVLEKMIKNSIRHITKLYPSKG